MALYIIKKDYLKLIQDVNLAQIINSNEQIRIAAEKSAIAEAKSFLRQKYAVESEIRDLLQWSRLEPYSAGDRVYLDANAYSEASTYAVNDLVLQNGAVYSCIIAVSSAEPFNAGKWSRIGLQYDIFSANYPFQPFSIYGAYKVGDKVYYKGKTYSCLVATGSISHDTALQYESVNGLPLLNMWPDDETDGAKYWSFIENYIVPVDTSITAENFWMAKDTRDEQLVEKIVDICLYHIHARIAPNNIPKLRSDRYKGAEEDRGHDKDGNILYPVYSALGWLQGCAKGNITPNLPKIEPQKGQRIRWGGNIKNNNHY